MTAMDEREGLIARIRQLRRLTALRERADSEPHRSHGDHQQSQRSQTDRLQTLEALRALEARVAHLERLLEGLQDSVHRESERHRQLIAELQAQVAPATMAATLAEDARKRGL